jgi:prevent-host-death family protein
MSTANIAELKNRLSAYLAEVKQGGEVIVSERNIPFAKIVPLRNTSDYDAEELDLVARGIMTLPETDEPLPDSFWEDDLPVVSANEAIDLILSERDED